MDMMAMMKMMTMMKMNGEEPLPLEQLSNEKLQQAVSEHELWLDTRETDTVCGKPLDFSDYSDSVALSIYQADLSGRNLTDANFNEVYLQEVNFTNAILIGANFIDADLDNAILVNVNATNANFDGATLIGTDMTNANLTGASCFLTNFRDATLSGTILTDATDLENAHHLEADQLNVAIMANPDEEFANAIEALGTDEGLQQ